MQRVTVDEIQRNPLKYINQVEAGESFIIIQADKPIFDRMLIYQALHHGLTIATVDAEIVKYSVSII